MEKSIGLVVVLGGVAEVFSPRHIDIRVVDLDENSGSGRELPSGSGFEELAWKAGIADRVEFVDPDKGSGEGAS